jgi:flagellar hook-basal body complex protein FliE
MQVPSISGVGGGISPIPSTPSSGTPASADFGSALNQAIDSLQQLGTQADSSTLALAKGDPVDVHEVMLNTEQASLGFSLALQIRNKLVDAYTEIMHMSM